MTNEQAKKMLKAKLECLKRETSGTDFDCNNSNCDECSLCYEQGNMGEQKEALDMAIKALEQQPCEDTISRQAAIDAIMGEYPEVHYPDWYASIIKELPSAQPEIIRCKDCRYYQDNYGGYPHMNCKWDPSETPDADDYCSAAERRTNA